MRSSPVTVLEVAHLLIEQLQACGKKVHFYPTPGMRNSPLLKALSDRVSDLDFLSTHIDERSSAFRALGHCLADPDHVAVLLCTSGSAMMHFMPALMEAWKRHLPLIMLTADRPYAETLTDGAQTLPQYPFFALTDFLSYQGHLEFVPKQYLKEPVFPLAHPGVRVSLERDIVDLIKRWGQHLKKIITQAPGPMQLNMAFFAPLWEKASGNSPLFKEIWWEEKINFLSSSENTEDEEKNCLSLFTTEQKRLWIWTDPGPRQSLFSREHFLSFMKQHASDQHYFDPTHPWWVYARETSDLIDSSNFFFSWDSARAREEKDLCSIDLLIHTGQRVTSKFYEDWWTKNHSAFKTLHIKTHRHSLFLSDKAYSFFLQTFSSFEKVFPSQKKISRKRFPLSTPSDSHSTYLNFFRDLGRVSYKANFLIGNSLMIRTLSWIGVFPKLEIEHIFHLRGHNGIEGHIGASFGIHDSSSLPLIALMGDLTFFHDISSLLLEHALSWPKRQSPLKIIVLDNSGGGIFDLLKTPSDDIFKQLLTTPEPFSWEHIPSSFKLYTFSENCFGKERTLQLQQALSSPESSIIRIKIHPEKNTEELKKIYEH
jgi:2-succinyl-5-enolpyruvyl-6-hydroxy-3-cyclohexene-1-carboxylate synthase